MSIIKEAYQKLRDRASHIASGFPVAEVPGLIDHRIGISSQGLPMFFIKCYNSDGAKSLSYDLETISVEHNKQCTLWLDSSPIRGLYTIIALKDKSVDLQDYFLDIGYLIICNLSPSPELKEIKSELGKLINLFSQLSKPPQKTIQGLWAELFLIERSKSPDYLIKAWHAFPEAKFDFNDGIDKIEVKSTSRSKRVHSFSIEQLNPNIGSSVIIASVMVAQTGVGKSIFDLVQLIESKVTDATLMFLLNEIIAKTLGKDLERSFEVFFDYQQAIDTLQFYDCISIPKISASSIPAEISNVHFECDLSAIECLKLNASGSLLHQAAIIS